MKGLTDLTTRRGAAAGLTVCSSAFAFLSVFCLAPAIEAADPLHTWTDTYDGGGAYQDDCTAALTDDAGNLILAGESFDGVGGSDMLIRKLDRLDHSEIWQQRVPSFDTNDMAVSGMVLDNEENVLVAGYIRGCEG